MNNGKLALNGLLQAVGTTVYIILVSLLLFHSNQLFGNSPSVLNIITMLCLLVLSASIVSTLLLGRSVLWYFNGAKSEAIKLFFYSIIWLLVFTVIFLLVIASLK